MLRKLYLLRNGLDMLDGNVNKRDTPERNFFLIQKQYTNTLALCINSKKHDTFTRNMMKLEPFASMKPLNSVQFKGSLNNFCGNMVFQDQQFEFEKELFELMKDIKSEKEVIRNLIIQNTENEKTNPEQRTAKRSRIGERSDPVRLDNEFIEKICDNTVLVMKQLYKKITTMQESPKDPKMPENEETKLNMVRVLAHMVGELADFDYCFYRDNEWNKTHKEFFAHKLYQPLYNKVFFPSNYEEMVGQFPGVGIYEIKDDQFSTEKHQKLCLTDYVMADAAGLVEMKTKLVTDMGSKLKSALMYMFRENVTDMFTVLGVKMKGPDYASAVDAGFLFSDFKLEIVNTESVQVVQCKILPGVFEQSGQQHAMVSNAVENTRFREIAKQTPPPNIQNCVVYPLLEVKIVQTGANGGFGFSSTPIGLEEWYKWHGFMKDIRTIQPLVDEVDLEKKLDVSWISFTDKDGNHCIKELQYAHEFDKYPANATWLTNYDTDVTWLDSAREIMKELTQLCKDPSERIFRNEIRIHRDTAINVVLPRRIEERLCYAIMAIVSQKEATGVDTGISMYRLKPEAEGMRPTYLLGYSTEKSKLDVYKSVYGFGDSSERVIYNNLEHYLQDNGIEMIDDNSTKEERDLYNAEKSHSDKWTALFGHNEHQSFE